MAVGQICSKEVDTVEPGETVWAAAKRMQQRSVGTLAVIDEGNVPIGILTDRDLVTRVLAEGKSPSDVPVKEVMSSNIETVYESTPVEEALGKMRSGPFRRLVVVDGDGRLVGLVSLDDVLGLLAAEFKMIGDLVESESPMIQSMGAPELDHRVS